MALTGDPGATVDATPAVPQSVRLAEPGGPSTAPIVRDTAPWFFPPVAQPAVNVPTGPAVSVDAGPVPPAFLRSADLLVPAHAQPQLDTPAGPAPLAVGNGRGATIILPGTAAQLAAAHALYTSSAPIRQLAPASRGGSLGGIARVLVHAGLVGHVPRKITRTPLIP